MSGLNNYSFEHPLILLTDYSPHFGGGGAVNLRSVMDQETRPKIVWVTLTPGGNPDSAANPDERVEILRGGPIGTTPRTSRSLFMDIALHSRTLADEVLAVAEKYKARGLWVVMHGAAVPIAAHLIKRDLLPVMVSVHDDPAFGVALRSRRYLPLFPLIERSFRKALQGAARIEVVSRGMMDRYRARYGVESKLGNRAIRPFEAQPAPFPKASKVLRIGILGNTYAYSPLPILGKAVAKAARELGLQPELVFVGQGQAERLRAELGDLVKIVAVGQVDEAKGVEVLRDSFLQYLNYPFHWRDRVLRQTSFPIKLGTYIAAGRPLLLHTPLDSSTAELAKIPGLAHGWSDLDIHHGAEILCKAWHEPETFQGCEVALEQVRQRYFDFDTIRANVFGMLNQMARGPGAESDATRL